MKILEISFVEAAKTLAWSIATFVFFFDLGAMICPRPPKDFLSETFS
jgi:hypothetical protein